MPQSNPRIRVAIIGGGVAGLSLALALRRSPNNSKLDVQIFEKERDFVPNTGSGMVIWPRTMEILRSWGVAEEVKDIVTVGEDPEIALEVRRPGGTRSGGESLVHSFRSSEGVGMPSFHRAHLLQLLSMALPRSSIHFSTQLASYTQLPPSSSSSNPKDPHTPGTIHLTFTNGTSATCDILLACDGLYSKVRHMMYDELRASGLSVTSSGSSSSSSGSSPARGYSPASSTSPSPIPDISPHWTGTTVFRAQIPLVRLKAFFPSHRVIKTGQIYCGSSSYIHAYPSTFGQTIHFFLFLMDPSLEGGNFNRDAPSWLRSVTRKGLEDWVSRGGWGGEGEEVRILIRLIPDETFRSPRSITSTSVPRPLSRVGNGTPVPMSGGGGASTWPVNVLKPLPTYIHQRVALVGDAAHATSPHTSLGPSSAIEDAFILASLLSHRAIGRDNIHLALSVYDRLRVGEGRRVLEGSEGVGRGFGGVAIGTRRVGNVSSSSGGGGGEVVDEYMKSPVSMKSSSSSSSMVGISPSPSLSSALPSSPLSHPHPHPLSLDKLKRLIDRDMEWIGDESVMDGVERGVGMLERVLMGGSNLGSGLGLMNGGGSGSGRR